MAANIFFATRKLVNFPLIQNVLQIYLAANCMNTLAKQNKNKTKNANERMDKQTNKQKTNNVLISDGNLGEKWIAL